YGIDCRHCPRLSQKFLIVHHAWTNEHKLRINSHSQSRLASRDWMKRTKGVRNTMSGGIMTGTILILGGTGKTGSRVAQLLAERGEATRIGSRTGQPPFDWDNRATWRPALRGAKAAYIAYAPDAGFPDAAEKIGAFADLAVSTG